jgi:hypothetical protein
MPSLIDPAKPNSRSFAEWVAQRFLAPPLWPSDNNADFFAKTTLTSAYLATYGFDGYDLTSNQVTYTVRDPSEYTGYSLDPALSAAAFFGLPTRAAHPELTTYFNDTLKEPDFDNCTVKDLGPEKIVGGYLPRLGLIQLIKNFVGGWEWSAISTEKKLWQIVGIPLKFVILLIKIATIPFKTALNILKFFTEYLPLVLSALSALAAYRLGLLTTEYGDKKGKNDWSKVLAFPLSVLTLAIVALHIATRILVLVSRAFTSPEKSARMAFAYGRELKIEWIGEKHEKRMTFLIGVVGGLISVSLSAALWAITLPLFFGALVAYFPAVAQTLAGVLHWPVIAPSMTALNGLFTALGAALSLIFSPIITPLSGLIGFQISATLMAAALSIAVIAAPITAILSRIADELSNLWAQWQSSGPFTLLFNLEPKMDKDHDATPLLNQHDMSTQKQSAFDYAALPDQTSTQRVSESQQALNAAYAHLSDAEKARLRAGSHSSSVLPLQLPANQKLGDSTLLNDPDHFDEMGHPLAEL